MTAPTIYHELCPINAERAVLGSILVNPDVFPTIREYLNSVECFADESHQVIFSAMIRLWHKDGVVDPTLLIESIIGSGAHTGLMISDVVSLYGGAMTSEHAEAYARCVLEAYQMRLLAQEARCLSGDAETRADTIESLRERAAGLVEQISRRIERERVYTSAELAQQAMEEMLAEIEAGGGIGFRTGIRRYDEIVGGLLPGLHIIGARPSIGKTAMALNIAYNVSVNSRKRVLFVSMEMSGKALLKRMTLMGGNIDAGKLRTGFLGRHEQEKIAPAILKIQEAKFEVMQASSLTPSKLRLSLQRYTEREPLDLVIIDYLQLMSGDIRTDNRATEVASISRALKNISTEFSIPVVALSQVSRDADETAPKLSQLRESGAIEQDADTVMFLHPEKDNHNQLGCIIAKTPAHY